MFKPVINIPSKPELGWKSVWHFDRNKSSNGAYKVEHTPLKILKKKNLNHKKVNHTLANLL
jgi:hypothetical protein